MNKNIIFSIVGLVAGGIIGFLVVMNVGVTEKQVIANAPDQTQHTPPMQGAMDSMLANLQGKTGADFDKAFIDEMIVHHEGAVDMAEAAKIHAEHQEIKDLADAIITAQTKEIEQMKEWRKTWFQE